MKRKGRSFLCIIGIALIGMFVVSSASSAQEEESSSAECIACHTDLDAMDNYGADAAKGGAGIAG